MQDFWYWLIAGVALMTAELLLPGIFLLWLGLAAFATGVMTLLLSLSWQWAMAMYSVLAIVSIYWGKNWYNKRQVPLNPSLNNLTANLQGKVYPLVEAIVAGHGKIKVGDTVWRVQGKDTPEGALVKVVYADGTRVEVEAVHATEVDEQKIS